MAIWLAAITIVVVVLSTATNILVVQPVNLEMTNKMFEKMDASAKAQGAPPNAGASIKSADDGRDNGDDLAVTMLVFLSIYPVTTLILLNTAGARAACLPKKNQ